jgi:Gram-negative bacterial TonB protein C-terminal
LPFLDSIRYLFPMRFLAVLLFASSTILAGQTAAPVPESGSSPAPIQISGQEALARRIGRDRPAYPRFALAAGVEGAVKADLVIGPDGSIQKQGSIAGPPSLIAAAQAWIDGSRFRPFLRDGQPVSVTTTLPVVFALPRGANSAHPLPAIYQRSIKTTIDREGRDNPPRVRWPMLTPAMRDWIARYEAAIAADKTPDAGSSLDEIITRENDAPPLARTPGNLAIYQIPLALPHHGLYLFFEFSSRCGKSNCPMVLLEESPAGVHAVVSQSGLEADLHRRPDSPYPDVLIWSDTGEAGISSIAGYSYYAGEWGQLYCGTDDAAEDTERDEQIADRHGAHIPEPPLATLCK